MEGRHPSELKRPENFTVTQSFVEFRDRMFDILFYYGVFFFSAQTNKRVGGKKPVIQSLCPELFTVHLQAARIIVPTPCGIKAKEIPQRR